MTAPDYADLRRRARESIDGRAAFEANHRKSDKPLTPIVLEPHVMLALLDERKALIRERDEARAKVEARFKGDRDLPMHDGDAHYLADLRAATGFQKPVDKV